MKTQDSTENLKSPTVIRSSDLLAACERLQGQLDNVFRPITDARVRTYLKRAGWELGSAHKWLTDAKDQEQQVAANEKGQR